MRAVSLWLLLWSAGCAAAAPAPAPAPSAPAQTVKNAEIDGEWELRWDRTFSGWKPSIFEGTLSLRRDGARWNGELTFRQSVLIGVLESAHVDGDRIELTFRWDSPREAGGESAQRMVLSGWIREGRLIGEIRTGPVPWTPVGGRRIVPIKLVHRSVERSLPAADPAAAASSQPALKSLLERAEAERSSAVVIVKDGKVVVEMYQEGYDGAPLVAMSVSKSVVSLAVGLLVADGKLSLDTAMGSLFPEWTSADPRSRITVRQLMSNTSGLDPSRADWSKETIRSHALGARLVFPPGSRFQYDNDAADFLAVVVKRACGLEMDELLETRIFRKLDVVGASWMKDSERTPRAAGELFIRPVDLAKIGQLMLDGGAWHSERILPRDWVERSVEASQPYSEDCGLLWWRDGDFAHTLIEPVIAAWKDAGIDGAALLGANALLGRRFSTQSAYAAALEGAVGHQAFSSIIKTIRRGDHVPFSAPVSDSPVRGFSARGWLGQFLIVVPSSHLVAVRMRKPDGADYDGEGGERNGYPTFAEDVAKLF
jgi:CubicO group peptidase (beta-lactamase class C family)